MDFFTIYLAVITGFVSIVGGYLIKKSNHTTLSRIAVMIICFIIFLQCIYALLTGQTVFDVKIPIISKFIY
ncbi:hypothetical protein [Oceanivirga salmonicida]|uniref:hypothetical protein n=1 Tax=Oceanivirga salmonicida TaxID=1769291 RepID=UPI00083089B8|nr:hypothetical protein [Oceanivirga salmonicida]